MASRSENTARTDLKDGIPSTPVETLVQIKSPPASREPQVKNQPSTSLIHIDDHIITKNEPRARFDVTDLDDHISINDPRANLNASKTYSSRSGSPANGIASDAQITRSEPRTSLSRKIQKSDQPENHDSIEAHSSRNDPWTNRIDSEIHSPTREPREYFNSVEIDRSEVELQASLNIVEVHTPAPVEPQLSLETKIPKRKSRASLDTSEPNTSRNNRTSSENSTDNTESNNILDRNEALLKALGDDLSLSGERIHPSLAQKWTTILRKGLPDDVKNKLLKEYAAPENCKVLKAPTLNDEVFAVVDFQSRNRDKIMESKQNQLGLGITAIGRAITVLLNQGENYEVNAMRHFNHGCRILLDLHYVDTTTRKHLFKKDLSRSDVFRNLRISDFERDETLFGTKVAKLVKKQGIPTTPMHPRPRTSFDANAPRDGEPSRYRRN